MSIRIVNTQGEVIVGDNTLTIPGIDTPPARTTDLAGQAFTCLDLTAADFTDCDLSDATFTECVLRSANFWGATLAGARFIRCRLVSTATFPADGGVCSSTGEWSDEPLCTNCECCERACNCYHCEDCGDAASDPTCGECDRCSDCCSCYACNACGERFRRSGSVCSDCERCSNCACECTSGEDIEECEAGAAWKNPRPKAFKCTRSVGVEWEYNSHSDPEPLSRWLDRWRGGYHSDGSCGWELVTTPLQGDHIANCIRDLGRAFDAAGASADKRCGIHVHVDARDLQWSDMLRLLRVYSLLEPILYLLAGQHRATNRYCAAIGGMYADALMAHDPKDRVLAVAYRDEYGSQGGREYVKTFKPGKKARGRYKGLNICPWLAGRRDRGDTASDTTVEFRLHCNTLDAERVTGWAQLCARLVDWSAKASDNEARSLPKSALRALCIIAPDLKPWIMSRVKGWRTATTTKRYDRNGKSPRRISIKEGTYQLCAA